jgi:Fe(3+) dicitrate transport protein
MYRMKKKITLIIVFYVLLAAAGFAQKSFSGRVLDATHRQPLIGAIIQLQSNGGGTTTDQEGRFKVMYERTDEVFLIKYLGYEDQRIKVSSELTDGIIIELERAQTTLNEVIVSASPGSYRGDIKGSNFRISPIALRNINPISTEEVLRTVPGVNIIGDMGISNRPNISIRGSWGRRSKKVLLMEDGTPSAPAPYIAPGAYYNPVSDRITSIEVYKGADMLRYGPNNMYGAVNYITALPPQKPQLRAKLIGGQRNYQTALLSYGGTWQNLGALVEGVYKKFDGFTDNASVELLNLNAKIFAKLSDNQSLYFKVSGQFEDNQASLSSQTPFTFEADPTQNPFDADQFTMRRYGVDIIHKWLPNKYLSFTSKIYASDFERDWWRQITTKVKASEARNYLGEQIFQDRYAYLNGRSFGPEDYIIVGKQTDGREMTSDSRWIYTVSGFKENMEYTWQIQGREQHLEASFNLHRETFKDRFLIAENSRWARNGRTTTDLYYRLWSANAFIRNEFNIGQWGITPILRFEHVDMYRQDLLALANNPNILNTEQGREPNIYNQFLPGITVEYRLRHGAIYGSIYQGMIAPSKVFGFLVEQDGIVTNPLAGQSINIDPELSWNKEIGWRGSMLDDRIDGQVTYFHNASRNFYAGGRNEVFQELGKINVQGLEVAIGAQLWQKNKHQLRLQGSINLMESRVIEGRLVDKDLFSQVIHSTATKQEYIDKVNANRDAFNVYISDGMGGEIRLTDETLDLADFDNITKSEINFGSQGVEKGEAPYTPAWNASVGLNYNYGNLSTGINGHFISDQFTEFHNFEAESADGAIGKLPAYHSIDAFVNYDFTLGEKVRLNAFLNGKNITNEIYRASRLNRATSGIFGGGFRQIIFGINMTL